MLQDLQGKLNPGLPLKKQHSIRRLFSQANQLKFKEEASEMLHLGHIHALYMLCTVVMFCVYCIVAVFYYFNCCCLPVSDSVV